MTMVFTVKNPALLDQVKTGDKVKFNAVVEDGKIVVTEIEAAQ
jgi:Cu/Ag efflux protein CusF